MHIKYFFTNSFVLQQEGKCFLVRKLGSQFRVDEIVESQTNNWWHWVGLAMIPVTGWGGTMGALASHQNTCDASDIFHFASTRGGNTLSAPTEDNGWRIVEDGNNGQVIESVWGLDQHFLADTIVLQGGVEYYHANWWPYQPTDHTEEEEPDPSPAPEPDLTDNTGNDFSNHEQDQPFNWLPIAIGAAVIVGGTVLVKQLNK